MSRVVSIAENLLDNNINVSIPTLGFSMFPVIRTGDRITLCPDKDISLGDIIVFRRNCRMVCHRVVKIFEKNNIRYYQTRGDSFFTLDEPVTRDQILGRVMKIEMGKVTLARRILLLLNPLINKGILNAIVVSALTGVRRFLYSCQK
jgi:signal peptidase I